MSFIEYGTHDTDAGPILRKEIILNSAVTTLGDATTYSGGFADVLTAATPVLGQIVAHVDYNGLPLLSPGTVGSGFGTYAGTYTVAADNQTVAKVSALLDVSKMTKWTVDETGAGVPATDKYKKFVVSTQAIMDTATAHATTGQYVFLGVGSSATKGIFNIFTSAIFG